MKILWRVVYALTVTSHTAAIDEGLSISKVEIASQLRDNVVRFQRNKLKLVMNYE